MFTSLAEKGIVKVKKKIAIIILGLTVALSMVACGNKDNLTEQTETSRAVEVVETTEKEVVATTEVQDSETKTVANDTTSSFEIVEQGDYPDSRSDHQANWDTYKKYFDDFSVYGTDTAGKEYNDLPYCGDTGYDPKGTILQERTTDKGYTVLYDTNTGKVYYSSMILPTGSGYDEEKSSNALVQYILDNDIFSVYDLTYSQFQEILGVYNGD